MPCCVPCTGIRIMEILIGIIGIGPCTSANPIISADTDWEAVSWQRSVLFRFEG